MQDISVKLWKHLPALRWYTSLWTVLGKDDQTVPYTTYIMETLHCSATSYQDITHSEQGHIKQALDNSV